MTAPETPGRRGQVQVIEVVGHGTEEHYLVRWQTATIYYPKPERPGARGPLTGAVT